MKDFWLWYVLGSLILIGPLIYEVKLIRAMNLLCKEYNQERKALAEAHRLRSR